MPKTYEQLLKDQTSQSKPPAITVDVSHLMEEDVAEKTLSDNDDNASTTSGVTEGPEIVEEPETVGKEQESNIELFGNSDGYTVCALSMAIDYPISFQMTWFHLSQARSDHVDLERLAARKFIEDLQSFIPSLNVWRSPLEVDLALQQFASEYCEGNDFISSLFDLPQY